MKKGKLSLRYISLFKIIFRVLVFEDDPYIILSCLGVKLVPGVMVLRILSWKCIKRGNLRALGTLEVIYVHFEEVTCIDDVLRLTSNRFSASTHVISVLRTLIIDLGLMSDLFVPSTNIIILSFSYILCIKFVGSFLIQIIY